MESILTNHLSKDKYLYMNHYFTFSMEKYTLKVTHKDLNNDLTEIITKEIKCDVEEISKFIDAISSSIDEIVKKINVYGLGNDNCTFKKKLHEYVMANTYNNFLFAHNYKDEDNISIQNAINFNKEILEKWGIAPSVKILLPIADSNDLIEAHLSIYPSRPAPIDRALICIKYNDNTINHDMIDKDILEIVYDSTKVYNLVVNTLEYIDSKIYNINQYDVFNNIRKINTYFNVVNKVLMPHQSFDYVSTPLCSNQLQPNSEKSKNAESMKQ